MCSQTYAPPLSFGTKCGASIHARQRSWGALRTWHRGAFVSRECERSAGQDGPTLRYSEATFWRTHQRAHRLRILRNQLRIKQVCLGKFPQRAIEIANLSRIHHSDGNRRLPQRTQRLQLVASGRLQHHELRPNRCQILQQFQMPRRRIVETALHSIQQYTELQSLL